MVAAIIYAVFLFSFLSIPYWPFHYNGFEVEKQGRRNTLWRNAYNSHGYEQKTTEYVTRELLLMCQYCFCRILRDRPLLGVPPHAGCRVSFPPFSPAHGSLLRCCQSRPPSRHWDRRFPGHLRLLDRRVLTRALWCFLESKFTMLQQQQQAN